MKERKRGLGLEHPASDITGLYWRRDGRKAASYLILVFVGAQGLMMRVVEASHASVSVWNDGRPIDRQLDRLNYGEGRDLWAYDGRNT